MLIWSQKRTNFEKNVKIEEKSSKNHVANILGITLYLGCITLGYLRIFILNLKSSNTNETLGHTPL